MLNIYRSRESIDKESFIYGKIKAEAGESLVIVPDQYTLTAELQAMKRMDTDVLLDVEITAISKFGNNILEETGRSKYTFIDKYGRYMLLYKILTEKSDNLEVFDGVVQKQGFLNAISDFISKAKQSDLNLGDLIEFIESGDGSANDELTKRKLSDLKIIFDEYESRISNRYTDAEDLIELYINGIFESRKIKNKTVWIYGFDSFTPRNLQLIEAVIKQAKDVNIYLTFAQRCKDKELFDITGALSRKLCDFAKESKIDYRVEDLDESSTGVEVCKREAGIKAIEKALYSPFRDVYDDSSGIRLVKANNIYSEAESAAAFVLDLLQKEKLRYRDIVIICNEAKRAEILKRVFQEYGIKIFADRKRAIASSPISIFVVSLIEAVSGGMKTGDVFKVIKTGFMGLDEEDVDFIENYAIKYRIRGKQWFTAFEKGTFEYGEEELERLNGIREKISVFFEDFRELYTKNRTKSNAEFIGDYVNFLLAKAKIDEQIDTLANRLNDCGMPDKVDETLQIWELIMNAFSQIVELMGDEPFKGREFVDILTAGLLQMEVGVIPPVSDEIMLGTMQRSRCGDVKAMLIFGANEGIIPILAEEDELFSAEELSILTDAASLHRSSDEIRRMEESLAIYRNLSKPEKYLWIGYSMADGEGSEIRKSEIVERLLTMFPSLCEEEDVIGKGDLISMIGGKTNTVRHFTEAIKKLYLGEKIDGGWQIVSDWLKTNENDIFSSMSTGLSFENIQKPLPEKLINPLYGKSTEPDGVFSISPSRIEKFSRCPFSHFVSYGLRPEERREFAVSAREIGDLHHETIMYVTKYLSENDRWADIDDTELKKLVIDYIDEVASNYRDGIFSYTNREKYWHSRAKESCFQVCKRLVEHARAGKIEESYYEESFGRGKVFPAIEISTSNGRVYIEGKIDRVDVLEGNRVKIIDYKTGREKFDKVEAEAGYRLQLMLYLEAAQGDRREPAGVFYFLISDPKIAAESYQSEELAEAVSDELKKSFMLEGIMVDTPEVIEGIAGDFELKSDVVGISRKKDGTISSRSGVLLNEAEFKELQLKVRQVTEKLCDELLDGRIDIRPKKTGDTVPCTYCEYNGICRFDLAFDGCTYDVVK